MTEQQKYIAGQKAWIEANGVKGGSKMWLVRKADNHEKGWGVWWASCTDSWVGGDFVVRRIQSGNTGIALENTSGQQWNFPYFVLEIIKKANGTKPIITNSGEQSMSTQEQKVFDVTIIERTEVLHEGSGVVQKINRTVLFDEKVSAVTEESAKQQALQDIDNPNFDDLEITCQPF